MAGGMANKASYSSPKMVKGEKSATLAKAVGKPHKDGFVSTPATMLKKGK